MRGGTWAEDVGHYKTHTVFCLHHKQQGLFLFVEFVWQFQRLPLQSENPESRGLVIFAGVFV